MQLDKFDQSLNKYLESITLTTTQENQINNALEGVLTLALTHFPDASVDAQGSFSTDTMTKPLTSKQGDGEAGEFDIDIAIEREIWSGAGESLDTLADAVEDDDTFGNLIVDRTKNTCVRIEYPEDRTGVAFHIDLVPTKLENGRRTVPDRDHDTWKPSDAKRFAQWFNAKAELQPGIRQVAIILKRLRDLNGLTDNLKSIMVLTLVVENYLANGTIMGDLLSVLEGAVKALPNTDEPPFIANPINTGENLAAGITNYQSVRAFIVSSRDKLLDAISAKDTTALKDIFGAGFDYTEEEKAAVEGTPPAAAQPLRPTRAYGVSDVTLEYE